MKLINTTDGPVIARTIVESLQVAKITPAGVLYFTGSREMGTVNFFAINPQGIMAYLHHQIEDFDDWGEMLLTLALYQEIEAYGITQLEQ